MRTGNWQQIPFCIDKLKKITPQRILVIGAELNLWGMILCDYASINPDTSSIEIEGVDPFQQEVGDTQQSYFNRLYRVDPQQIISSISGLWDVILLNDILEYIHRPACETLLDACLIRAGYVLVNVSMGSNLRVGAQDFPQKSIWTEADFQTRNLLQKSPLWRDNEELEGSFLLSRKNPLDLQKQIDEAITPIQPVTKSTSLDFYIKALNVRNQQLLEEIDSIKKSHTYRFIELLKNLPGAGILIKLGKPYVSMSKEHTDKTGKQMVDSEWDEIPSAANLPVRDSLSAAQGQFTADDQKWLEQQRNTPRPLSLNHPDWRGILASATELFGNVYLVPDDLDKERAYYYASLFREANLPSITIQGFPISYYHLVKALHKVAPQIPVYAMWHGNFLYSKEDYDWRSINLLKALHEEGVIAKVGFVKKGMAEVMERAGMRSAFIQNLVRRIPSGPSKPMADNVQIAIWGEPDWGWKKLPYAMVAALSLVPGANGHVFNVSPRVKEFSEWFKVNFNYQIDPIPHKQVIEKLSQMHLSLYIALAECAPMLPLESLSVGAPCLFGPTSHYFLDHDYLHSRLVVPSPDNAEVISRYIRQALEERAEIINAYIKYAPEYNHIALQSLADFLEFPLTKLE